MLSEQEKLLNDLQRVVKNPHGARYDAFTFQYGIEYLKRARPRVLFISLDETDEHGHGGRYDEYLKSAHRTDEMIGKLWNWIQSDEQYKNKTTLLITTDHGRGKTKNNWNDHGMLVSGSSQTWYALLGNTITPHGEMKYESQAYQKDLNKLVKDILARK